MNRIEAPVRNARRRVILGILGRSLCVSLFIALLAATFAIAAPGIWVMEIDINFWNKAWIIGSVIAAVAASVAYALMTAPSVNQTAMEVDRRFGLRERLSSSLTMAAADEETTFGRALVSDAERRADQIRVAEKFPFSISKLGWLPVAIAPVLAVVMTLVQPASESVDPADEIDPAVVAQIKQASLQLKKRIEQQKRNAIAKGLDEARDLFAKMEKDLNEITEKKAIDRKQAMIALNDLKKQLEQRREQLGSNEQMRKAMSKLNSLQEGPAKEAAKSIAKGDFAKAEDIVRELAKKISEGKLSEKEKKQLENQIKKLRDQLKDAADQQKRKQEALEKKIEQAKREGRSQDAAKMQQQLNDMKQKSEKQTQQMQQMAQKLSEAAQAMQNGDSKQAADALGDMADQLSEMQDEMSELQDLESALNDLSQSKEQIREGMDGMGMGMDGMGMGFGDEMGEGMGMGEGPGRGDRPEEETDTNTYETQVRGNVRKGKALISGFADGPNRKGVSREDLKQAIESSMSEDSDPLENQRLPRTEQEYARDYFNKLRGGE
ncbi:MAG: hypothetical protein AAF802_14180 [Planctomycetota bacterium]